MLPHLRRHFQPWHLPVHIHKRLMVVDREEARQRVHVRRLAVGLCRAMGADEHVLQPLLPRELFRISSIGRDRSALPLLVRFDGEQGLVRGLDCIGHFYLINYLFQNR